MVFIRFLVLIFLLILSFIISFYVIDKFMKNCMFEVKAGFAVLIFAIFFYLGIMIIQFI